MCQAAVKKARANAPFDVGDLWLWLAVSEFPRRDCISQLLFYTPYNFLQNRDIFIPQTNSQNCFDIFSVELKK